MANEKKYSKEKIASGVQLVFSRRTSGRLVARWDGQWVMINSVRFAQAVQAGYSYEVDVYHVDLQNKSFLTCEASQETMQALFPGVAASGSVMIRTKFQPKRDRNGVFAVEPLTGKLVFPIPECRVWVNQEFDYLAEEHDQHLKARPLDEPPTTRFNREKPDAPYTFMEKPFRRDRPPRRPVRPAKKSVATKQPSNPPTKETNQPPQPAKKDSAPPETTCPEGDGTLAGELTKMMNK